MARSRPTSKTNPEDPEGIPFMDAQPSGCGVGFGFLATIFAAFVLWNYFEPGRLYLEPKQVQAIVPPLWEMASSAFETHILHLGRLACAVFLLVAVGRALSVGLLRIIGLNRWEELFLGYALGLGVAGNVAFYLALSHCLGARTGAIAVASLVIVAVWGNRDLIPARKEEERKAPLVVPVDWVARIFWLAVSAVLGAQMCYALAPETFWDSLTYHLALPSLFRLKNAFVPTPENMYSGIPMLFQMDFLWGLAFDGEILAKLLHWSTGLGIVVGMAALAGRVGNPLLGALASLIFVSTPLVGDSLVRAGVDAASAYWILAAIYSYALFMYRQKTGGSGKGLLYLSALFSGFALSAKYTNWPFFPVMLLLLLRFRAPGKDIAIYGALSLSLLLPWVGKNIWAYSNPIFPYFNGFWNPHAIYQVDWRRLHTDGWGRDWPEILAHGRQLIEVLLHPWFVTMRGNSDFDDVGPLYLLLLPFILTLRCNSSEAKLLSLAALGLWLSWWPLTGMPRFFISGMVLLSILGAMAIVKMQKGVRRQALLGLILLLAFNNSVACAQFLMRLGSSSYLLGKESKADYLSHPRLAYPSPPFRAIEWINRSTAPNARVLMVGDGRSYYLKRDFAASSTLDEPMLFQFLQSASSADDLYARLISQRITHLLVNMALVTRMAPPPDTDGRRAGILSDFMARYSQLEFEERDLKDEKWLLVYSLGRQPTPRREPDVLGGWYRYRSNRGGRVGAP